MHPGNIFVLASDPRNPRYAAIDFGIMGTLDPSDQHYLAENFLAVFDRDYRRVALLHVESGWVPPNTRVDEMESAVRTVLEPIFNRPLKDVSFGNILVRLFEISRRFNMEVQPQLILLQKTLLNVEGLGRDLYPELDIWQTASPILRDWMRERLSVRQVFKDLRRQLPELIEVARSMPTLLKSIVDRSRGGRLQVEITASELESLRQEIRRSQRHRDQISVGAAILFAGLLWTGVTAGHDWAAWACATIGAGWIFFTWRRRE
jgi:ubiquinone biosynthesis protein